MKDKNYFVKLISQESSFISNNNNEELWERADVLTDFVSPWSKTPINRTEFRALWDKKHLFFRFKCYDSDLHINLKDDSFESIGQSDRVELFIRSNKSMSPYYCFEIDTQSRVMDFKALPNRNFDMSWSLPKSSIEIKRHKGLDYFIIEGRLKVETLKELSLINSNSSTPLMEVGVYRAKYNKDLSGNYSPTWITWVDPKVTLPDFHLPSSFGTFYFDS